MKKNRMWIVIGIVVAAACAIILLIGRMKRETQVQDQMTDGGGAPPVTYALDIKYLYYFHGGGMLGDAYTIELSGGSLQISDQPAHNQETVETVCEANADLYGKLDAVIAEYEMKSWTNLPQSEVFATDGPSTSLEIDFSDGSSIRIDEMDELPEGGWTGVRKLVEVLESAAE